MNLPLVERFIQVSAWPTCRKTALLTALALPAHVLVALVVRAAFVPDGIVDIGIYDVILTMGAVALVICLCASLLVVRSGSEGRWTAYSVVVLYGTFLLVLCHSFGLWTTFWLAWAVAVILLVTLWYDERVGLFAFAFGVVFIGLSIGSVLLGVLPYAPAIRLRVLDDQVKVAWIVGLVIAFFAFFLYSFVLSMLVVAARRLQDARLREAHAQLARSSGLIRRYVPAQIADKIMSGGAEPEAPHERRRLTLFFSDLVGFTEITEELEPEDLSRLLNDYFSEMTAIASRHGGTVDELSGDAILVFFGAPVATDDRDHALRAVRMAVEMQAAMQSLNRRWLDAGIAQTLQVRMGVNTGVVTIGDFGSRDRMKYAVLGKHVNLAARLQAASSPGGVLLSHATWLLVQHEIDCIPHAELQLKGIAKPVMTYRVASVSPEPRPTVPAA